MSEEITKKFKGNLIDYIDKLQQENQQLKEQLELNDCKTIYNQFVNYKNWYFEYVEKCEKYKSVLDEIREFIKKCSFSIEGITNEYHDIVYAEDIKEILDKVGKE